jgi:hypothetical protein
MSHFLYRPEIYNQPIRLSVEERENPLQVLGEYFSDYDLGDVRHQLWLFLSISLTASDESFCEPIDRANLLTFYERTEELIEAAFILAEEKDNTK